MWPPANLNHPFLRSLAPICAEDDCSNFFTATSLKPLGVKWAPIDISHESGTPEFNFKPRFFQPHPDPLIAKHNLKLADWYPSWIKSCTKRPCPTTDEALAETMEKYGTQWDGKVPAEDWKYRRFYHDSASMYPIPSTFMVNWQRYAEGTCLGLDALMSSWEESEAWHRETEERTHLVER